MGGCQYFFFFALFRLGGEGGGVAKGDFYAGVDSLCAPHVPKKVPQEHFFSPKAEYDGTATAHDIFQMTFLENIVSSTQTNISALCTVLP